MKKSNRSNMEPDMIPAAPGSIKHFFWVIREYWVDMVVMNMAFVIFCLPVITAPAAFLALYSSLHQMYCGQEVHVIRDFWRDVKREFIRSLLPGIILIVGAAIGYLGLRNAASAVSSLGLLFPIAIFLWVFVVFSFSLYALPIAALVELPMAAVLKNALILTFACIGRNTVALLIEAALTLLVLITVPVSVPLLLFIHFSLCAHISMSFAQIGLNYCMIPDENNGK